MADLATALLPVLNRPVEAGFNVFDVMHHGTHEKQLSNVFRWLLDTQGSHHLQDRFLQIFIDEVNRGRPVPAHVPATDYLVLQEVNTADDGADIADLVLTNAMACLVVENYFTSDGHGHDYNRYFGYSCREGRQGVVVLLCHDHDSSLQTQGWEKAAVVTYNRLVDRLWRVVAEDSTYQRDNPEAYAFIDQMHRKFVKERNRVEDSEVLDFVVAMCETGQAGRYAEQQHSQATEGFANEVAEQARARFVEGRELLMRIKHRLTNYGQAQLRRQLNETLGEGFVGDVSARYVGNYRWTVNFSLSTRDLQAQFDEEPLQLKFGPSAWFANERDPNWEVKVPPALADYSRLFITWAKTREIRQSVVTLHEVLDGLAPDDLRLHDEIVRLVRG